MTLKEVQSEKRRVWWTTLAGAVLRAKLRARRDPARPARILNRALSAWNTRGKFKRRQKSLESAFRAAVRKGPKAKATNLQRLHRAALRVGKQFHQRVNTKLLRKLRRYFEKAFATGSKSKRSQEMIGCTVAHLREHLEKQFKPGMTWANHSFRGWHIDHIRPLASFDMRDPEQQRQAFHFSNLQPLWMKENFEKSDRV